VLRLSIRLPRLTEPVLLDPRLFNFVLLTLYIVNAGRWAAHGSWADSLLLGRCGHDQHRHHLRLYALTTRAEMRMADEIDKGQMRPLRAFDFHGDSFICCQSVGMTPGSRNFVTTVVRTV
jgi:hypothetical protein